MQKTLSPADRESLMRTLSKRFEENRSRHDGLEWDAIKERMETNPGKLWSLHQMEETGGEPDVIGRDEQSGEYLFYDCAAESPKGRRSLCYDRAAWESRKENKPKDSALELADAMGIQLLTEAEYRRLQGLGEFDLKTSSWVQTPQKIRKLGGALFCDRRFDTVFLYHNGAESYYAARGFRGVLKL
ncbi:MAG: DUF4256 domain-containing protein [Saprospiraceae bacterium]